jgi:hypothetical protein
MRLWARIILLLIVSTSSLLALGLQITSGFASLAVSREAEPKPRGPIQDNSFLIEEAYNQEDGVVQHISCVQRSFTRGEWVYSQTDEWPMRNLKHQFSVNISSLHTAANTGFGFGDTALNYRYQLVGDGETTVAVAPRVSLLLPTGDHRLGHGAGGSGLQTNLPISVQHSHWLVSHWNAGGTWIPHARNTSGKQAHSINVNLGNSVIWLASQRLNLLLETLWTSTEEVIATDRTARRQDLYLSPGLRWAYNFRNGMQIVPGIAVPMGVGPSAGQRGLILYLSFEHPWRIAHSR